MKDRHRTKEQRIDELAAMRRRVAELEALEGECKRTEEALRQSESRYKALFESNLDGLVVIDESMRITMANRAAAEIGGFDSTEELLNVNLLDFIAPEDRDRTVKTVKMDMFVNNLR